MDKYTTELSSATQSRFLRSIFRLTFCLLLVVFTTTASLGLSLNAFQILLCQLRLRQQWGTSGLGVRRVVLRCQVLQRISLPLNSSNSLVCVLILKLGCPLDLDIKSVLLLLTCTEGPPPPSFLPREIWQDWLIHTGRVSVRTAKDF